jgi:hypothetical protein
LPDATNPYGAAPVAAEGLLQLLARSDAYPVAEGGVGGYAAIEGDAAAVGRLPELATQAAGRGRSSLVRVGNGGLGLIAEGRNV